MASDKLQNSINIESHQAKPQTGGGKHAVIKNEYFS